MRVRGCTALVDAASFTGGAAIGVALNDELQNDLEAIAARVNGLNPGEFIL